MFASRYRFHGHGSLRFLFKNGDAFRTRLLTIKATANPHRQNSRFSVIISKKVHKSAVGRNRVRRRVYEILRGEMKNIEKICDVAVIITSGEAIEAPHEELTGQIREQLTRAGVYK